MDEIEGTVTSIDENLLSFSINSTTIHMALLLARDQFQKLPELNTNVCIKNMHYEKNKNYFIACETSSLSGTFECDYNKNNRLIALINETQLGVKDLIQVVNCYELMQQNFVSIIPKEIILKITCAFVKTIIQKVNGNNIEKTDPCSSILRNFHVVSPSNCVFIEKTPDKYEQFPLWSFGVHVKQNAILFGYLKILPQYGYFVLNDSGYNLACVISSTVSRKIDYTSLINKFVLIRKVRVITEIFGKHKVSNLDYVMVDFSDIFIVCDLNGENIGVKEKKLIYPKLHNIQFEITNKSMPVIDARNIPEIWLETVIKFRDKEILNEPCYLIVPLNYLSDIVNFEIGDIYDLYHDLPLKRLDIMELKRLRPIKQFLIQENTAVFRKSSIQNPKKVCDIIYSWEHCKEIIKTVNHPISFQGIIKQKTYKKPLPSRTQKRTNLYGYGSPVHPETLQLTFRDRIRNLYLDFYLNNWENMLMPIGLIPGIQVIIRNVQPQSKKYLKSTVFTRFDIVGYAPKVDFETTNLHYKNGVLDWGKPFCLGRGRTIPTGALVYGIIQKLFINTVRFYVRCFHCEYLHGSNDPCLNCGRTERRLNLSLTMTVEDEYGSSKIISKEMDVFKSVLGIDENDSKQFSKACDEMCAFEFQFFHTEEFALNANSKKGHFALSLSNLLRSINEQAMVNMELKCRKLDAPLGSNRGMPLWYCTEARWIQFLQPGRRIS